MPETSHMQSSYKSRIRLAVVAVALAIVAMYIWPTGYRYDHMTLGSSDLPVRINRFTGKTEVLQGFAGWVEIQESDRSSASPPAPKVDRRLSSTDLAKIEGTLALTNYRWIEAHIYNGTEKRLGDVTVQVTVFNSNGTVALSRQYRLSSTGGEPLRSSKYIAESGISLESGQRYEWSIVSAEYY